MEQTITKTLEKARKLVIVVAILMVSYLSLDAQSTETFFGLNYWEYQYSTDLFEEYMPETTTWNTSFIRIGGNYPNNNKYGDNDKDWYVKAIQNVKSMGAIPLVQLSIHLSATEAGEWYDYFNYTKNLGIVYWAIGNEPDPSGGQECIDWFKDKTTPDADNGMGYYEFRGQFRTIAKKIKEKDANSIVVGPDFRHWWGEYDGNYENPFNTFYSDFLFEGDNPVGTDTYNGDPIIDIFAFHYYGDANENDMQDNFAEIQSLLDKTNALRPYNQPIKIAIGEYNTDGDISPSSHKAGQYMATMARKALAYNAVFFCPWSVSEGWNFKMIDDESGYIYSTGNHWKMLSINKRDDYMKGQINNNVGSAIMQFGMSDNSGYTIMLMNSTGTNYSASVNFSTNDGDYSNANGTIKFRFNANVAIDFGDIDLTKNTTLMYTFDANGNMLKKYVYDDNDNEPTITTYNGSSDDPLTSNYYNIQNLNTSDYLRPRDSEKDLDGGALVQYENPDLGWSSIQWSFEPASIDGYYNIVNKYNGYCLRPKDGGTADNTEIGLVDLTGKEIWSTCMWTVEETGDGYYWIKNKTAGKYLRPLNYANGTDVNIVLYAFDATWSSIKWDLTAQSAKSAEIVTKVEDNAMDNVLLYPNPANNSISVKANDTYHTAIIYGVTGKLIKQANLNESKTINIENLNNGLYIVNVIGNGNVKTIKLFKE
ncbi:MAG: RICIN domain-containing protein [Salinivirgaceae bacterium]|jgi:hypothetical protein|nr:RICIN domain-containing protein [Salinivirgaceae bacterium]